MEEDIVLGRAMFEITRCKHCMIRYGGKLDFTTDELKTALVYHARECTKEYKQPLPTYDEFTEYSHVIGTKRQKATAQKLLRLSEEVEDLGDGDSTTWLVGSLGDEKIRIRKLSDDLIRQFTQQSLDRWGKAHAEVQLSSTPTASLYLNVVHRFGPFDQFIATLRP